MLKKKKDLSNKKYIALLSSTIILGIIVITLGTLLVGLFNKTSPDSTEKDFISLGSMKYTIKNDRAELRNDASVNELRTFLEQKAKNEGCGNVGPAYETVIAYTKNETQALLGYGCGSSDAQMHIVKTDSGWRSISPTNHFDEFGIPECEYLNENTISAEIAPVCYSVVEGSTEKPLYKVR